MYFWSQWGSFKLRSSRWLHLLRFHSFMPFINLFCVFIAYAYLTILYVYQCQVIGERVVTGLLTFFFHFLLSLWPFNASVFKFSSSRLRKQDVVRKSSRHVGSGLKSNRRPKKKTKNRTKHKTPRHKVKTVRQGNKMKGCSWMKNYPHFRFRLFVSYAFFVPTEFFFF